MEFSFLETIPVWILLVIVAVSSAVVWISGSKLSHYAGIISERTGLGQAVIGAVLLGGITSLPEMATTVTASLIGSAPIAVNNILGGVSMQITVLAVADFFARRTAISFHLDTPQVKIQIIFNILLLALVLTGILFSDVSDSPVWTALILAIYVASFFIIKSLKSSQPENGDEQTDESISNTRLTLYSVIASFLILAAGFTISVTGESIAERTSLGENLAGALLIAATTSLPELSTTIAAAREKKYKLAASNIFGSNLIILALLFVADISYTGSPVLSETGTFSQFGALLGIVLATIYLTGITARKNKHFSNAGYDSWLVLLLYSVGLWVMFLMR